MTDPDPADATVAMSIWAPSVEKGDSMWAGPKRGWVTVRAIHHGTPIPGRVTFDTSTGELECGGRDQVRVQRKARRG